jgi:ABC-type uncharacterized transport system substrate-binding protein
LTLSLALTLSLTLAPALAQTPEANPSPLPLKRDFKVIYFEAGPYRDYALNLAGLAKGLAELGLIENWDVPVPEGEDAEPIWRWLAEKAGGSWLVFPKDGFYSGAWDETRYPTLKRTILNRLRAGEADLILAFGTVASLIVATDEHNVPVMSITATDPVSAGISESVESSGRDHVHVQVEVVKIKRQLGMFHQVFGFKTLGVPYDATESGRATMGVETIKRTAEELGFTVIPCVAHLELASPAESQKNLGECLKFLAERADAIYLTVSNGATESAIKTLLAPAIAKKLPTFSQKGPSETRRGVLMSLAEDDFANSGRHEAKILKAILEGAKPGSLPQAYVPPLTMALNFQTALDIGWDPPFDLLAVVDELYVDDLSTESPSAGLDPTGSPVGSVNPADPAVQSPESGPDLAERPQAEPAKSEPVQAKSPQ